MDRTIGLPEFINLLCRTGGDPVLQSALQINQAQLIRLRQLAAKETTATTSYPKFGIATAFGTSKMSASIICPPEVRYEIRLDTIFLYTQGKDRFKQYTGSLPFGMQFGTSLAEIRDRLGKPLDERGGEFSHALGILPKRLKYDAGKCFVWFEFDSDEKVEMVCLVGYCYGT